jgi:hypothetical protein
LPYSGRHPVFLILAYSAVAVAAAHRLVTGRGIAASVASFVFFVFAFVIL